MRKTRVTYPQWVLFPDSRRNGTRGQLSAQWTDSICRRTLQLLMCEPKNQLDSREATIQIGGIVLAGGTSRRMGTPKEWLNFAGEPMLARVVRIVALVASPVVVVAQEGQVLPPLTAGVETAHDGMAGAGPLAGIVAGFDALGSRCAKALVVSCDHPLVDSRFLQSLVDFACGSSAVVASHDGRTYPLLGVYPNTARDVAHELLTAGERRARVFAEGCGAVAVDAGELCGECGIRSLVNVNDERDYAKALSQLR
jgi:molybdopterin-guanine dinucleotide biosynthesis protein A